MWAKLNQMNAREAMISLAGKPGYGEQKRWLKQVADAANISQRAARNIWRGEISDHNHRDIAAVKRAAELKAFREADALADTFKKFIRAMESVDPDFFGPHIAPLLDTLRAMGRSDRT